MTRFTHSITGNNIKTISFPIIFNKMQTSSMQVKTIEPIKEYSKVFTLPDQFNLWLSITFRLDKHSKERMQLPIQNLHFGIN